MSEPSPELKREWKKIIDRNNERAAEHLLDMELAVEKCDVTITSVIDLTRDSMDRAKGMASTGFVENYLNEKEYEAYLNKVGQMEEAMGTKIRRFRTRCVCKVIPE